jgi:hypothetical protein
MGSFYREDNFFGQQGTIHRRTFHNQYRLTAYKEAGSILGNRIYLDTLLENFLPSRMLLGLIIHLGLACLNSRNIYSSPHLSLRDVNRIIAFVTQPY